jgi:hypothetical protein
MYHSHGLKGPEFTYRRIPSDPTNFYTNRRDVPSLKEGAPHGSGRRVGQPPRLTLPTSIAIHARKHTFLHISTIDFRSV